MSISKRDIIRAPDASLKSIQYAYRQFAQRIDRLAVLDNAYYTGQGYKEYDFAVNYCKLVADTKTSYVAGIPPTYSFTEGDVKGETIIDLYREQVKPRVDQELVAGTSRYGLAYEVVYLDDDMAPNSATASPLDAFVAYDETLDPSVLFGCIHYAEKTEDNKVIDFLDVYDERMVRRYRIAGPKTSDGWTYIEGTERPHGFDRVPIIEYRNNPDSMGDFECILDLQDAVNEILSDRIKDKTRFANAVLLAQGVHFGDTKEEVEESLGTIKDMHYLAIPKDANLSYLVKTFDEASVQVLVDDVVKNIHKVSMIPDLSDENFAANASGVAMKYKLLGLNNLAQSQVAEFSNAFRIRCKLFDQALGGGADIAGLGISFRFNAPEDSAYDAQTLQVLLQNGIISLETARSVCTYVDDPAAEAERIEKEQDATDERNRRNEEDLIQQALQQTAQDDTDEDVPPEDEE